MKYPVRLTSRAWLLVPLFACVFIIWINTARIARVDYVTGLAGGTPTTDHASTTGYANGFRHLIVPEHNNQSLEWIVQTQDLVAGGPWRLRHVNYDNSPQGREVFAASPYRWWLGFLAWVDHALSSRPLGVSVERAALIADPLLHGLFLIGSVTLAAAWFGRFPAAMLALGLAAMFPFAGSFLAGQPGDHGLVLACILWSVLPLLAGGGAANERRSATRRFFLAGVAGGFGLWLRPGALVPIVVGIGVGAVIAAWIARRSQTKSPARAVETITPWRVWSVTGAVTTLLAFLVEYVPSHMSGWQLESVHPIYAIGWLGGGELVARAVSAIAGGKTGFTRRSIALTLVAVAAFVSVPVLMGIKGSSGFLALDPMFGHLTHLPNGVQATSFGEWLTRDGFNAVTFATLLPLAILTCATWIVARSATDSRDRGTLCVALGPIAVALVFACSQLRWWNALDGLLLALMVALIAITARSAGRPRLTRWFITTSVVLLLAPGFLLLIPRTSAKENAPVNVGDVTSLIERDLAQWIAQRAGPGRATVLASPSLTSSLIFHGGVRGIGTPYRENKAGLSAAIRLAGTTAQDEAMAVVQRRELTHIVLASWDSFLDDYARSSSQQPESSLVALLHGWTAPRWLRPVPYTLPNIPGFEQQSVKVFEVVELQDNAVALGRLAESFLELRRADFAASVSEALERSFPDDLGALVSRAMVWSALGNTNGFATAFNGLLPLIEKGADQDMLFDRRVSLAIVLTEGKRIDLARHQVERCVEEIDEMKLRSLTPVALYRLHYLLKAFDQPIADPDLKKLSVALLPVEMRGQL